MCAINGFNWENEGLVRLMNQATIHRGPDATDVWVTPQVSLGHNRLAIIDLDERASQPMKNATGNLHIVFNGEIYNYRELKEELKGYPFKTESDTEVLLAAYERWGAQSLLKLKGIFALAIWNSDTDEWFLARDHMGVKPLYYYADNQKLIFSSELRGVLVHDIPKKLSLGAYHQYLHLLYVPGPETLVAGINKLMPGTYLRYRKGTVETTTYWKPTPEPSSISGDREARVREVISAAVKRQLVSDRPVGIFLSGGFDSTIVLHHGVEHGGLSEAFSVGFTLSKEDEHEDEKFNTDLVLAKKSAALYGVHHNEYLISAEYVAKNLTSVLEAIDEPISNPTEVAIYALAQSAKEKVPVILGGDGGDELFGGYARHRYARLAEQYRIVPEPLRRVLGKLDPRFKKLNAELGAHQYLEYMAQKESVIEPLIPSLYKTPETLLEIFSPLFEGGNSFTNQFLTADLRTWLVDESLTKTDKLSMRWGIEARVPLLDIDVVSVALSLPIEEKVGLRSGKKILKKAYKDILPQYLYEQPKRGWFSPGAKWLRDPSVREIFKDILSPSYYPAFGSLISFETVERYYKAHEARTGYYLPQLWALATFLVWARKNGISL